MPKKDGVKDFKPLYKIGAVSNITGLTTHSIRAWERRYGLKIAQRSEKGTRLYTDEDITLLSLLRDLKKRGDAIGELAGLSEETLRERLKLYKPVPESMPEATPHKELADDSCKPIRAMVLGDTLAEYLGSNVSEGLQFRVQCKASTPEDALDQLNLEKIDILLARIQNLGTHSGEFLERWNEKTHNKPALVFYDLSNSALIAELTQLGAKMVKWPVDLVILSQMVTDYCMFYRLHEVRALWKGTEQVEASSGVPKRLFSNAQLMNLLQASNKGKCDCLKNISFILSEVNSLEACFDDLSGCLGEDRAFHQELHQKTAQARALFESMLIEVCSHEKLEDTLIKS